jgi:hypothetical protein
MRTYPRRVGLNNMASSTYSSALSNWLASQQESRAKFAEAESPLIQLQGEFAPGGAYQKGQFDIINQEGLKAGAEGMQNLASTGMSSGSLAVGLGARIRQGIAAGKTGVEASRVANLTDVLKSLSGLRASAGAQLGSVYNPFANTQISGEFQTDISAANRQQGNINSLRSFMSSKGQNNTFDSMFSKSEPVSQPSSASAQEDYAAPRYYGGDRGPSYGSLSTAGGTLIKAKPYQMGPGSVSSNSEFNYNLPESW